MIFYVSRWFSEFFDVFCLFLFELRTIIRSARAMGRRHRARVRMSLGPQICSSWHQDALIESWMFDDVRMFQILFICEIEWNWWMLREMLWNVVKLLRTATDAGCGFGCWTYSMGDHVDVVRSKDQISYLQLCSIRKSSQTQDWSARHSGKLNKNVVFSKFPLDTDTGTWGIVVCPSEVYLQTEPGSKDRECCRGSNVF